MDPFWPKSLELIHEDMARPDVRQFLTRCRAVTDHCRECGAPAEHLYRWGTITRGFNEVPAYPQKVVYYVEVQRWKCRQCNKTFSQALPDMDERHHMTKRCVRYIRDLGVPDTFISIARAIGVTEKTIRNICTEFFVGQMEARTVEASVIMGIDELKLDGQMRAIFMDIGGKQCLDLIPSHRKDAVAQWLYTLPKKELVQIINIDMARPYRDVVREILPQAAIVVDKFHIQRTANKALDKIRNRVRNSSTGAGRRNPWGPQRLLRKRAHGLSVAQAFEVDGILKNNPLVQAAWACKEAFMNIWAAASRADAERMFVDWKELLVDKPDVVRRQFGTIARMVERWHGEVFSYFDYPTTNAFTENRNGLIKIINRTGRGYSFPIIRAKALLAKRPADKMGVCDACKKPYPVRSLNYCAFRSTKHENGEADVWMETCGNCAFVFHKHVLPSIKTCHDYLPPGNP